MNILIVGKNEPAQAIFAKFGHTIMVCDTNIPYYRKHIASENGNKSGAIISSSTNIRKCSGVFRRVLELRKWIEQYNVDIILTNDKFSMIAARLAAFSIGDKHIKLLTTSHNSYAWNKNTMLIRFFLLISSLSTHGFIVLSSHILPYFNRYKFYKKPFILLPNTINASIISRKKVYKLKNDFIRIVCVAVLSPSKGQLDLLRSLVHFKTDGIPLHITFFGDVADDMYAERMKHFIKEKNLYDLISFKGRVKHTVITEEISDYDIYVSTSYAEMSPLNILEAKAAALPIVSYNVGGIPDILTNNVDSLLCEPGNITALTNCIKSLILDEQLRCKLGSNAYTRLKETQTIESAAEKLEQFVTKNL